MNLGARVEGDARYLAETVTSLEKQLVADMIRRSKLVL